MAHSAEGEVRIRGSRQGRAEAAVEARRFRQEAHLVRAVGAGCEFGTAVLPQLGIAPCVSVVCELCLTPGDITVAAFGGHSGDARSCASVFFAS